MVIFSFLALGNLRSRSVRQIQPVSIPTTQTAETTQVNQTAKNENHRSKRNVQLIRLSLLQVLVFTFLNTPWTVFATFMLAAKADSFGLLNYMLLSGFLSGIGVVCLYIYGSVLPAFTLLHMKANIFSCLLYFRSHSLSIR